MELTKAPFRNALLDTAHANVGPGWFTSVMGTGVFAIGLQIAPIHFALFHALAVAVFALDVALFVGFAAMLAWHYLVEPRAFAASLDDSVVAQLWGAPPMAAFTVAVGLLLIGGTLGFGAAGVAIAQVLFVAGVVLSVFSAAVVPFRMFTQHDLAPERAFGSWLLPVVPPIVASVPAALLSATWPAALRSSMLVLAYALLGIGIFLAAILIVVFYSRLLYAKVPESALVTTTWIVVGPLGQSVAGIIALGAVAQTVWPEIGTALYDAGIAYGLLVWGFGVYWLGMAIALTIRGALKHLPFTLGWWAFTFPVGTLMSGSYALFHATHAAIFEVAGYALLALLAAMWSLVGWRSVHHSKRAYAAIANA